MRRDKCVYVYRDENGTIFYVGQGSMIRAHETTLRSEEFKQKLITYEETTGEVCYPEIVIKGLTPEQALCIERFLIANFNESELVNKKPGRPAGADGAEFI